MAGKVLLNQRHRVIDVSTASSHLAIAWRHMPYAEPNLPFRNDKTLTFF
jgi:hypothetical protein